jgi:hypothetical protein
VSTQTQSKANFTNQSKNKFKIQEKGYLTCMGFGRNTSYKELAM